MRAIDVAVSEAVTDLRWAPLTTVMLLASAWWVKDFLFVLVALWLGRGRTGIPWPALVTAGAAALSPLISNPLKQLIGRPRPFAQGMWSGLGPLPASSSMPSGHAVTAFAAAVALGAFFPRVRRPALAGAALIGLSRVYLGVHFAADVVVGAMLGALLGAATAAIARRLLGARWTRSASGDGQHDAHAADRGVHARDQLGEGAAWSGSRHRPR